jgi:uncharacterized protein (TIGR02145 family)
MYWLNRNPDFNNATGFSVTPAGHGNPGESENMFGTSAVFWTATKVDSHFVWGVVLSDAADSFHVAPQHPAYAFSVRCVRD